jgi:hypothetical protein
VKLREALARALVLFGVVRCFWFAVQFVGWPAAWLTIWVGQRMKLWCGSGLRASGFVASSSHVAPSLSSSGMASGSQNPGVKALGG